MARSPARAAGESASTSVTSAPLGRGIASVLASSAVTGNTFTPSQLRATIPPVAELADHFADARDRHRERQLAEPIAGRVGDADDLPGGVDDRAARVAARDARVGLHERAIAHHAAGGERARTFAAGRRHDARRCGDIVAERIAEHDEPLADFEIVGLAELQRLQALFRIDREQREIEPRMSGRAA